MSFDMFGDEEVMLPAIEVYLLRRIAEASHNMVSAKNWPEFREASGGQEVLDKEHEKALRNYESWLSDGSA